MVVKVIVQISSGWDAHKQSSAVPNPKLLIINTVITQRQRRETNLNTARLDPHQGRYAGILFWFCVSCFILVVWLLARVSLVLPSYKYKQLMTFTCVLLPSCPSATAFFYLFVCFPFRCEIGAVMVAFCLLVPACPLMYRYDPLLPPRFKHFFAGPLISLFIYLLF